MSPALAAHASGISPPASPLDQLVEAVLYEGYILYPYRPSSKKNRQRFTFGRVYPEVYSMAQNGAEPFEMQTECLVHCPGGAAELEVSVRFLQPVAREVGRFAKPLTTWSEGAEPAFQVVPELCVDGNLFQSWHEAVERDVRFPSLRLPPASFELAEDSARGTAPVHFAFPPSRSSEPLTNRRGQVVGVLERRQPAVEGILELAARPLDAHVFKITVRVLNLTPMSPAELAESEAVTLRTFASTHTILRAQGAQFISLLDPPAEHKAAAAGCANLGTWPVLVGDEAQGQRDTMLSSPIILYDYPKIAPESAGPLFDGTEIDELLTLRIQTMTDQEKLEMRQVDEHARRLLERAETLGEDALAKMHGAMRPMPAPLNEPKPAIRVEFDDFFGASTGLSSVSIGGTVLKAGDRVRIRPKAQADLMDLALAGQTAVVEAIEQDLEQRVHLALVLEADPGKDLGFMRQPGHRFFFGLDEVEPVTTNGA